MVREGEEAEDALALALGSIVDMILYFEVITEKLKFIIINLNFLKTSSLETFCVLVSHRTSPPRVLRRRIIVTGHLLENVEDLLLIML